MQIITLAKATPGLQLAKAVFTKEGRVFLPAGDVLSAEAIVKMRDLGISAIFINATTSDSTAQTNLAQENTVNLASRALNLAADSTLPKTTKVQEGALSQPLGESKSLTSQEEIPQDITDAAVEAVEQRFSGVPLNHVLCHTIFEVAVERQARLFLSNPQLVSSVSNKTIPGFQTKKPEPSSIPYLLASSHKLGTLPLVFHKLIEIVNNPNASIQDTAQVLSTDPALSAKLLRLVNSPYYGLAVRIDTIPRAVTLVGTGQIVMLAMGSTLMTAFKGMPISLINMQTFWNHSLACGVGASLLAEQLGDTKADSYFVAGLLHDIGRLIVYSQLPTHALYMLVEARRTQVSVYSLEKSTLGFTHEELSAALLEEWRCPADLVSKIKIHHKILTEGSSAKNMILPLGNFLSQALGYGSSGEVLLPPISSAVWDKLNLSKEDMRSLCASMDSKVRDLRAIFMSPSGR